MHTNAMQQEELWGEAGSSQCFSFGTFFFGPTQTEQTIVTMLVYDLRDTYRCLTTCSDPCSFLFQYIPAWKGQKDTGHKSHGSGCRNVFCPRLDLEKLPRTHLADSPKTWSKDAGFFFRILRKFTFCTQHSDTPGLPCLLPLQLPWFLSKGKNILGEHLEFLLN